MNEHFDGCAGMNELEWKKILGSSLEPSLFGICNADGGAQKIPTKK